MSNEHTEMFELRPDMTLAELIFSLALHFKGTDTDNAEFEIDGFDAGKPIKMAFSVSMRKVQ